jgi:hypothetical protein
MVAPAAPLKALRFQCTYGKPSIYDASLSNCTTQWPDRLGSWCACCLKRELEATRACRAELLSALKEARRQVGLYGYGSDALNLDRIIARAEAQR